MIVVIGCPVLAGEPPGAAVAGRAGRMASAAAAAGAAVQLVGKVGGDPAGDALVLALARDGVGHVALLRDPARPTPVVEHGPDERPAGAGPSIRIRPAEGERPALEPADVELGLRYLTDFTVLVVAEPLGPELAPVVREAATWSGATVVALVADRADADDLPDGSIALAAPDDDGDGAFDRLVGRLAAAIDAGRDPAAAFEETLAAAGWDRPGPDSGDHAPGAG